MTLWCLYHSNHIVWLAPYSAIYHNAFFTVQHAMLHMHFFLIFWKSTSYIAMYIAIPQKLSLCHHFSIIKPWPPFIVCTHWTDQNTLWLERLWISLCVVIYSIYKIVRWYCYGFNFAGCGIILLPVVMQLSI